MPNKLAGKRVLVVDDEALIAIDTASKLEAAGCTVVGPAARLAVALELAKSTVLDAAVLDINLGGGINVWPLAEQLASRGVRFILLSGYGAAIDIPPAFRSVKRLEKPIAAKPLVAALEDIFEVA